MTTRLCYILLFSVIGFVQPKVTVVSSFEPNERILYIGVDNYIKVEGITLSSAKLRLSQGNIYKLENNTYLIGVHATRPDTLLIYQGKKLVASEVFQIKVLPNLVARLAHFDDSVTTVSKVLMNPFLTVDLPGCNYKHNYSITSFNASCLTAGADTTASFNTSGNSLSGEQQAAIKTLKTGDQIYFYNIRAICPDCAGRKLPPFKIYIQ